MSLLTRRSSSTGCHVHAADLEVVAQVIRHAEAVTQLRHQGDAHAGHSDLDARTDIRGERHVADGFVEIARPRKRGHGPGQDVDVGKGQRQDGQAHVDRHFHGGQLELLSVGEVVGADPVVEDTRAEGQRTAPQAHGYADVVAGRLVERRAAAARIDVVEVVEVQPGPDPELGGGRGGRGEVRGEHDREGEHDTL
ncbi:MAG: hypothetical protein U5R14_09795 [Gemmatimonadota bacterium]|nr:hypothetical protein [Gemmatimonadota bacterium]